MKKMKNGKSAGTDGLCSDFFKNLPVDSIIYFQALFNRVLDGEIAPADWSKLILTLLHKKGDKQNPSNYRGIALCNNIAKMFTQILCSRLEAWVQQNNVIGEFQNGFRPKEAALIMYIFYNHASTFT